MAQLTHRYALANQHQAMCHLMTVTHAVDNNVAATVNAIRSASASCNASNNLEQVDSLAALTSLNGDSPNVLVEAVIALHHWEGAESVPGGKKEAVNHCCIAGVARHCPQADAVGGSLRSLYVRTRLPKPALPARPALCATPEPYLH
jgi:hypothetical protein